MVRIIKNSAVFILLLSVCFSTAAAEKQEKGVVLREGFELDYVKGVISKTDHGQWVFTTDTPMFDGLKTLKAQSSIKILPSSMLEKLTTDINAENGGEIKSLDVQLQANVVKYRGENYLFAMSYIPISQTRKAAVPDASKNAQPKTIEPTQAEEARNDPILSSEFKDLLTPDWTPDLIQKQKRDNVSVEDDYSMPSRTGFFVVKDGATFFQLDSLGRKIDRTSYKMLPCAALDTAEKAKYTIPGRKRYVVSGTVTNYKGQNYLLLQRVARTYNHGNFAR